MYNNVSSKLGIFMVELIVLGLVPGTSFQITSLTYSWSAGYFLPYLSERILAPITVTINQALSNAALKTHANQLGRGFRRIASIPLADTGALTIARYPPPTFAGSLRRAVGDYSLRPP